MDRRAFFKTLSWMMLAPFVVLSYLGLRKEQKLKKQPEVFIPLNQVQAKTFYNDIIISNINPEPEFYSNKCTHLGCRIHQLEDNGLTCNCHGSQFDFKGNPTKGPAVMPLKKLNYRFDSQKEGYIVFETN